MADKKVIMDLEVNVGESLDQLTKINQQLVQLQKEKKELDKAIKDGTATKEMIANYSELEAAIKTLNRSRAAEMREIYQEVQQYRYAADTVQGMSDRLRQMKDEYVKMSAEMRNSPAGKQLAQDIRETTTALAVMKNEMQPSFIEKFNQKLISITASFNRFPRTLSGLKASLSTVTSAFKVLFKTIIMNPIGLLITAITGLVMIFAKFFKETEAGQRIMKVFGDATKGLVEIITAFVNIVATAVEWVLKLIPAYRQAADAAEEAARSQKLYNDIQEQSNATEEKIAKQKSKNAKTIEQLNAKINDSEHYTLEERKKAIEEKKKLLNEDLDADAVWATQRSRFLETKKELTDDEKADLEKATKILDDYKHEQWKIGQEINSNKEKIQKEEKDLNDKHIQEQNKILADTKKLQDELNKLWREVYLTKREQEIEALDDTFQHNVEVANKTIKNEEERNKFLLDLTKKYREDVKAINDKYDAEEAAATKEERTKQLTKEEVIRQLKAKEASLKQMELDNQALFNARNNEIEKTNLMVEQSERRIQQAEEEYNRIKSLSQEQVEAFYGEGEEGVLKWKNATQEALNAIAVATREHMSALDDFNEALKASQLETIANFQTILGGLSTMTGAFKNLFSTLSEDDAEMQKYTNALSYINIMTNMAEGIAGAIAQAQSVPFPANLAAIATGVAAVVTGIGEALSIYKQNKNVPAPPKFAEGGLVGDQTSTRTDDSVDAKLSVGEYVVRSSAVKNLGVPFMNAINNGSVPSNTTIKQTSLIDYDTLASMVASAVADVQPVVSVKEINEVQTRVAVKENISKY